ncbi:Hypothetical predicted protein [Mytilus galloprovincialis]|uniref:Uncharacterized protein n=1 Tax=Mytilus galloprovincialis TaxID=29158 RepID=A0A8B6CWP1_MYTGA|nr:Hypothetical predicted protein [Mytilus galloprovincialis]
MAQPRVPVPFNAGGFGGEQRSDGIIQGLIDNNQQITNAVGIARNSPGIQLTSLTYRSQNAEGTNFVVKVRKCENTR